MKFLISQILMIFVLFSAFESNIYAQTKGNSRKYIFDIKAQPTTKEWKYFLNSEKDFKKQLWSYYSKQDVELGGWSWQWRLGWLRACKSINESWCTKILVHALFDNAAVVRGEAATKIGARYANTENKQIIGVLKKAYLNKKNMRNKKPLFIQQRILFALKKVGGDLALNSAEKLAENHKTNKAYWDKLKKW